MPAPLGGGLHMAFRPPTPIQHVFPRRLSSQTVAHSLTRAKTSAIGVLRVQSP